jgi:hypothetical protein
VPLQYFAPGIFLDEVRWGRKPVPRVRPCTTASRRGELDDVTMLDGPGAAASPDYLAAAQGGAKPKGGARDSHRSGRASRSPRPSGHITGTFARSDAARGIRIAPASDARRTAVNCGFVVPGEPITLVVKHRRDGPWARGTVEG